VRFFCSLENGLRKQPRRVKLLVPRQSTPQIELEYQNKGYSSLRPCWFRHFLRRRNILLRFLFSSIVQLLEICISSWLLVTSITSLLRSVCLQLRDPLFPREHWRLLTLYVSCLPLVLSLLLLAMLTDVSIGREVRRWRMHPIRCSICPTARNNNWGAFFRPSPNYRGAQAQG